MARYEIIRVPSEVGYEYNQKKRTLIIGIGGSGKEVVMRFRRKLAEIYDGLDKHKYIECLWIDTDSRNKSIRNAEWDKSFAAAKLGDDYIVDASMTVSRLQSFYDNFNRYQHYHHWFNYKALRGMGAQVLQQGASAMRPFGKLAFWHNIKDIELTLSRSIKRLKDANFDVPNLSDANDIDVYVIGSLAGGTGSGMIIDIAALLQKIDSNLIPTGIFFLSDIFANDRTDPVAGSQSERDANCFAALQELDFYMTPANQIVKDQNPSLFDFSWHLDLKHEVTLPIYKKLNLVSNIYENAQIEPSLEEAFNIVAEYLIMGYNDTGFDADVRSARTNVIKGYQNKIDYRNVIHRNGKTLEISNYYSTTYTSMGLGLIEFNKRRIKHWAKYKFLSSLCANLAAEGQASGDLYTDPEGKLDIDILEPEGLWRALETGDTGQTPVDELMKKLRHARETKVQELLNRPDIRAGDYQNIEGIQASLSKEIDDFFANKKKELEKELKNDSHYVGSCHSTLEKYKMMVLSKIPKQIISKYYNVLSSLEKNGISTAKAMIAQIKTNQINKIKEIPRKKNPGDFTYHTPDGLAVPEASAVQNMQRYTQSAQNIPLFFIGYRHKAVAYYQDRLENEQDRYKNQLKKAIENYAAQHENQISKLLNHSIFKTIESAYLEAERHIRVNVESLENNNQNQMYDTLSKWSESFAQDAKAFEFKHQQLSLRKLVLDNYLEAEITEDLEAILKNQKENGYSDFLQLIASKLSDDIGSFLREYDLSETPAMYFVYALANQQELLLKNNINLKKLLESYAAEFMQDFMANRTVDKELYNLLQEDKHREEIKRGINKVYEQSCMRLNFISHEEINQNIKNESVLKNGINNNASMALRELIDEIVGRSIGFSTSDLEESIVFFKEGSGFPLVAIDQLDRLRNAFYSDIRDPDRVYQRYTTKDFEYLRLLKCMDDSSFNSFSNAYRNAMKAVLLGVISYNKISLDNNQYEWRFRYLYRERGVERKEDLQKQLESISETLLQKGYNDIKDRIVRDSNLNDYQVKELIQILGAIILNLRNLEKYPISHGSITIGKWAMEEIQTMVIDEIKQKMASEYPNKDEMDAYIDSLYEEEYKPENYIKMPYYTSEFSEGIYVYDKSKLQ
ncbi:MAG: tubulin-like doman-containing protein [Candidatus Cloacimonetes bacterium]|nr:tubulin-like doman-containing protein [Candidatus Cloacimonadota bacterium]